MKLETTIFPGPEAAVPLVMAHGLLGSARNLGALARRLSDERKVIAVDMRNHGGSPWDDDHSYEALAGDLAEVIEGLGRPADVLGHSMGGKAAMVLALTRPALVASLIVADIAPYAYGHTQEDLIDTLAGLDLRGITLRSEADRRLSAGIEDDSVRAFLLQSLDISTEPARWKFNLDALGANMDSIIGWPEIDARFDGPVLMLDGAESDYVRPKHHAAIHRYFPKARIQAIEGAGHWLHAERPREVEAAIRVFLA